MKKVQIQSPSTNQDLVLNSSIKLKGQISALKVELDRKTKKYTDDIFGYNIKVNELEEIIEKKDAENSIETINLLNKISELEQKLLEARKDNVGKEKELNYRAHKLDEYELKINVLEETVKKLDLERDRNTMNIEQALLAIQQTIENKSDRTLKCLGDVLSTLKIRENGHREVAIKTPGAMECIIKMLQRSDDTCKKIQERNSALEVDYNLSIHQNNVLKSLLYNNIISRYNFHIYLANMFENAINGLLSDLCKVLQNLSVATKPTNSECLIQIDNLKLEYFKYKSTINDLQGFKSRIDENFTTNKISFTMESLPEFQNMYIPVSILHICYLPMAMNTLRQQNQLNMQLQWAYQQLNVPPVYMQPFVNNAPVGRTCGRQVSTNNFENSVRIEDISGQTFGKSNTDKSAESKNSVNSSNSKDENRKVAANLQEGQNDEKLLMCVDEKSENDFLCAKNSSGNNENDLMEHEKNCSDGEFISKNETVPKIAPFKITIKNAKDKTCVFDECFNEDIVENDVLDVVSSEQNDLLQTIDVNNSPKNGLLLDETCTLKNPSINSSQATNSNLSPENNPPVDEQISINRNTQISPNNSQSDFYEQFSPNTLKSLLEPIEGIDISVLDKLGGSNKLVKLYFFVKDKAKVEMLHTTDEQLINAILSVRKEHPLNGMRKKDILGLIFEFLKKQNQATVENTTNRPNLSFCVICFDSNDVEPSKTLSCNHKFHISCLQRWFQRDNVCPVCRKLVMAVDDLS